MIEFGREPHADFEKQETLDRKEKALAHVLREMGEEYTVRIGGREFSPHTPISSFDPADVYRIIGWVYVANTHLVDLAVQEGTKAFQTLRFLRPESRVEMLRKTAQKFRERKFILAGWILFEVSKPFEEAISEVEEAINFLEFYATVIEQDLNFDFSWVIRESLKHCDVAADKIEETVKFFRDKLVERGLLTIPYAPFMQGERNFLRFVPRGVTARIGVWNFPMSLDVEAIAASLAAGCPVILKPAEQSSVTAWHMMQCFRDAGVPSEFITCLPGYSDVGDALVRSKGIAQVSFTGSCEVGLRIHRAATETPGIYGPKRVSAEMGGSNAIIVCPSGATDEAVKAIVASFCGYNRQKCSGLGDLILVGNTPGSFLDRIAEAADSLEYGHPKNGYRYTAVIDARAKKQIQEAIAELSKIGKTILKKDILIANGHYVGPAIFELDRSIHGDSIAQKEIFGPVLRVWRVKDREEAVKMVNANRGGLTFGVFSEDDDELEYFRDHVDAGNIYENRRIIGALVGHQPFGGYKYSGFGEKVGTPDRLKFFMNQQTVSQNLMRKGVKVM